MPSSSLGSRKYGLSFTFVTGSTTYTMNVCVGIFRSVQLNDPVNSREIQTSCSDICCEHTRMLGVRELFGDVEPSGLLLTAVEM